MPISRQESTREVIALLGNHFLASFKNRSLLLVKCNRIAARAA